MPVGFQAINDDGVVQIDENYINMQLVQKGTVALNTWTWPGIHSGSFTYTGEAPIVALYSPVVAAVTNSVRSGNSWTFYISAATESPISIGYYVFDRAAISSSGAGLEIFNASGKLVYSSATKLLRIGAMPAIEGGVINSSRTYAMASWGGPHYDEQSFEGGSYVTTYFLFGGRSIAGGGYIEDATAHVENNPAYPLPTPWFRGFHSVNPWNIGSMAVDITGL